MFNNRGQEIQRNSAFRKLQGQETEATSSDLNHLGFATEMMQVINAQNVLIAKLLQRQNMLCQELNKRFTSSGSSSESADKPSNQQKNSGYCQLNNQDANSSGSPIEGDNFGIRNEVKIIQRDSKAGPHLKNSVEFMEDSNSTPFSGGSNSSMVELKPNLRKKQTETKNMVKNYAKAIFSFIRKYRKRVEQVLRRLGISQEDFFKVVNNLKGHIHSISELRALWTPEGSIYHQAFRIISCDYLRKFCLMRTFNSRVENFSIHLKYRQRLLQGLQTPEDFTALKTN